MSARSCTAVASSPTLTIRPPSPTRQTVLRPGAVSAAPSAAPMAICMPWPMPPPSACTPARGLEDLQQAVAPGAVRDGDVAHPVVVAAEPGLQRLDQLPIRAEPLGHVGHRRLARGGEIGGEGRIDRQAPFEAVGQLGQHALRIAMHEQRVAIAAVVGQRIGVDAVQRLRQRELVLQGFVAAQARADHQHRIAALVEPLHRAVHVEGAERGRMIFGQHAAPLHAGHHAEAQRHQAFHLGARMPRPAAEPQQRPARGGELLGQLRDTRAVVLARRHVGGGEIGGPLDQGGLDVDRDLDPDRAARRGLRDAHGLAQRGQHGVDGAHAEGRLGDRVEHGQLVRRLVDVGEAPIQVGRFDLPGDVQQRGAGRERLDHRAGRVAGGRAGAGEGTRPGRPRRAPGRRPC